MPCGTAAARPAFSVAHKEPRASVSPSAVLNCLIHHTARHCGLFQAVKIPGSRPMVLLPPELDPEQKLRINTYFMTPAEGLEAEALAEETTVKWRAGLLDVEIAEP